MTLIRTDQYTDNRYYYDTDNGKFYISATTFCKLVLPESAHLTKWKTDLGTTEMTRYVKIEAHYGTLMGNLCETILHNREISESDIVTMALRYIDKYPLLLGDHERRFIRDLKNDALAFVQWVFDRKVVMIDTEIWAKLDVTDNGGLAGAVDLVCKINWYGKERLAIVDLKKGRKGFYPAHELQLAIYKKVLDNNHKEDYMIFNWAPAEWRKAPSYHFKNQTESIWAQLLDSKIEEAIVRGLFVPSYRHVEIKKLVVGEAPQYRIVSLEDLLLQDVGEVIDEPE